MAQPIGSQTLESGVADAPAALGVVVDREGQRVREVPAGERHEPDAPGHDRDEHEGDVRRQDAEGAAEEEVAKRHPACLLEFEIPRKPTSEGMRAGTRTGRESRTVWTRGSRRGEDLGGTAVRRPMPTLVPCGPET